MLNDFTVGRRVGGPIASLDADRVDAADDTGADLDAGGGDDSQSSDDDAALDTQGDDAADESAREGTDEGDEDDDDDDDSDRYDGLPPEERIKKLLDSRKKLRRKLAKRTPVYTQVQDLARRGVTLEDLVHSTRQYRDLAEKIRQSPKLRALIDGGDDADERRPATRGTDRAAGEDADFTFDDSPEALGFDPKANLINKNIAAGLRRSALLEHRFNKLLARLDPDKLEQRVGGLEKGIQQSRVSAVEREWSEVVRAAEVHITDPNPKRQKGLRTMFRDNMRAAMERFGGRRPPNDIVTHYFNELGIKPAATARAAVAAARTTHQAAQRVTQLQRQPGQSGQPAPARQKRELLSDVHKRLRNAGTPAPR